jgi:hypothetical protein
MSRSKKLFYKCERCGKILIGNIKMRCLRRSCRRDNAEHWNIFNFFPQAKEAIDEKVESLPAEINSNKKGGES